MAHEVLALSEAEAENPSLTGHKAATLARLTARGVRVPPGFVITADVFEASASPLLDSVSSAVARADPADVKALKQIEAEARKAMFGLTLPARLMDSIDQARQSLGDPAVSVRSSATAEDMPGASFAGLYDSFLNVLSLHDVGERLLRVWASTYSTQAIAYRLRSGVESDGVKMAVLVQAQLDPEAAGVLFTRDPASRTRRYVVNAALGLGEGVVSGAAPADRYVLEPGSGRVLVSEIAAKDAMVSLAPGGDVVKTKVPCRFRAEPALGADALKALASLDSTLEDFLEIPQDVEFALAGGELYCLQSRPITAIGDEPDVDVDWEAAVDSRYHWELRPMTMFRGPLFPLQEDAATAYAAGQRTCFDETGRDLPRLCIMQIVEGYAYLRSPEVDDKTVSDRQERHSARCDEYIERGTTHYEENIVPQVNEIHRELRRLRSAGRSAAVSLMYLEAAIEAAGLVMGHLHWCMFGGQRQDWRMTFADITGEPPENADAIVGAISNMTTRLVARLRKLARIVQKDAALAVVFARGRYDLLHEPTLKATPAAIEFQAGFRRLMGIYGFRTGWGFGSGTSFEAPTWNMEHERPLGLIAPYASQDLGEMERVETEARRTRVRETRRVRRRLAHEPERLARFETAHRGLGGDRPNGGAQPPDGAVHGRTDEAGDIRHGYVVGKTWPYRRRERCLPHIAGRAPRGCNVGCPTGPPRNR